jgi:hypothetical protein
VAGSFQFGERLLTELGRGGRRFGSPLAQLRSADLSGDGLGKFPEFEDPDALVGGQAFPDEAEQGEGRVAI